MKKLLLLALLLAAVLAQAADKHDNSRATPAQARMRIGGKELVLESSRIGEFPRQNIATSQRVELALKLPRPDAKEPVTITCMDGGRIVRTEGNGEIAMRPGARHELDTNRKLNFAFVANADRGTYRVLIRRGRESWIAEFWAGEPLPIRR